MLWSAILAGISGGLAALVAQLTVRGGTKRGTRYTVVFIIVFIILNATSRSLVLPEIRARKARSDAAEFLSTDPMYSKLVEQHPEIGDNFTKFLVNLAREGASVEEARAGALEFGRSQVGNYLSEYAPIASSAALIEFGLTLVETLTLLEDSDGEACYYFLFGQGAEGSELLSILSTDHKKRIQNATAEVILTAIESPETPPTEAEGAQLVEALIQRLVDSHGEEFLDDMAVLAEPRAEEVDKHTVCSTTTKMYREVQSMPEDDQVSLLRYLLAG